MAEPYRVAVYYAPEAADGLWRKGCTWLGREPETGAVLAQPGEPGIFEATADPRRYGFHATLKPPMLLKGSFSAFLADVEKLARARRRFELPRLKVALIGNFLALCEAQKSGPLQALADDCVMALDTHRLPEDAAAQAKRANGRSPSELRNLERWGYPYVFVDWKFHMTLSQSIADNPYKAAAEAYFADVLDGPRLVESIAVFVEPEKGAPFMLHGRFRLGA